ncbi:GNAT family N-acetyltransferase, partial [Candidatus Bathyarchaeota archaeon]|nr:GNAT family N-acetyltransferase [Candidatus Bathyarchaeota archaeon]
LVLKHMPRGGENIQISTVPTVLGAEDADEIVQLIREADPSWWGDMTGEQVRRGMAGALWLGIRQDQELASVGMVRLVDFADNIGVIATKKEYRNRGYATSIVSALVKEIFKVSPNALIHVVSKNAPAVRVYSKVGFKPYKTYVVIRN